MSCYHFINLSNGLEALAEHALNPATTRFLRIQSTACEQKRWESILNALSPDFLMLCAAGAEVVVYDYGASKNVPRAIWQGLEWVKYALHSRWAGIEYAPQGRASSMAGLFEREMRNLSKPTKNMLDYYGKFFNSRLNIKAVTKATKERGDMTYHQSLVRMYYEN